MDAPSGRGTTTGLAVGESECTHHPARSVRQHTDQSAIQASRSRVTHAAGGPGARPRIDLVTRCVDLEPTEADAAELGDATRAAGYTPVAIDLLAGPAVTAAAPGRTGCCAAAHGLHAGRVAGNDVQMGRRIDAPLDRCAPLIGSSSGNGWPRLIPDRHAAVAAAAFRSHCPTDAPRAPRSVAHGAGRMSVATRPAGS